MTAETSAPVPPIVEQELGTLEVTDQVFCDIASRALSQVRGVAVVGRRPTSIFRLAASAPVSVERGTGEVAFSVHLTVRYNVAIPDMMREINERLSRDVPDATGYTVRSINVVVDHILPPVPRTPPAPASTADSIPDLPPVPDPE
ncbi:Asp23/Gls24 family envelope stress response protein [bacterium]|nr:Asp23/Gls24 family envelope stress response protein [bacterium]